jgi:hypothetical protein
MRGPPETRNRPAANGTANRKSYSLSTDETIKTAPEFQEETAISAALREAFARKAARS